ncbi:MAG: glycosyltransferase [Acidimicrobiia bacterium]
MTNILLATSNGTGIGHLTRQAAIALTLAGEHQPNLFSLSIGLPLAMSLGINGEYVPSYDRPWIASRAWNGYLRDRLEAIIEETASEVVLFDGVAAYPGIGKTSSAVRDVAFAWLRRGMWRPGTNPKQLRRANYFDIVIEPGDLAGDADEGPTAGLRNVIKVAPISLLESLELIPRREARIALGLPSDREIALVTLGSGRLGDVTGPGQVAIRALLEESDLHVAVTRSAVAENEVPVEQADRVTVIRDVFPLVRYLRAFDLAVSSAGYNAVHELVPSGLPTLFVANTSTRTDDQETRAQRLAELGLGLQAPDNDPSVVETEMRRLLDPSLRDDLAVAAVSTRSRVDGASETGRIVTSFAAGFTRRRPSLSIAIAEQTQRAKDAMKDALGEERTKSLKRMLGRHPTPIAHRAEVRLVEQEVSHPDGPLPLLVTESLTNQVLKRPAPVEHILPGSSPTYRDHRLELIRTYYDVVE